MKKLLRYLLLLLFFSSGQLMADSLTGAINYLSSGDGSAGPFNFWNTDDAENYAFNLYLFEEASPVSNANVLNPNGTALNYGLGVGVHNLLFAASNGYFINTAPDFTLNLFFEGSNIPGISGVWDSVNKTFIGGGDCTNGRNIQGNAAPCGGLSYIGVDGNTVTLTALSMELQSVNIVGGFSEVPDFNNNDQFTAFQLTVTPVPVPAAFWLFATGLFGLTGVARRKS